MRMSLLIVALALLVWVASHALSGEGSSTPDSPAKDAPKMGSTVTVRLLDENGEVLPPREVLRVVRTPEDWQKRLSPEEFEVARRQGTERAFCGAFHDHKADGVYFCVCCDLPLFRSDAKFDSGTGWPSFFQPIAAENVVERKDASHGMVRTEVVCARCDAHLGHVFDDGRGTPTGMRFCMNSVALTFRPTAEAKAHAKASTKLATFGAGCFWGVESRFRKIPGVIDTAVGYAGGEVERPTYREVCTDTTGHAEVVQVEYHPDQVSYEQLLDVFFENHDPTTLNRQGPDVGSQYRSVVFAHDDEQRKAAERKKKTLNDTKAFRREVVTAIEPAAPFWRAEEYHQRYLEKQGRDVCH